MTTFYVTTAIPYVNAEPHLGFALELVQADVLARYHRLLGDDTWFLTGTDENSLTNVLAAEQACVAAGDVYRRPYRGPYCVRCERFYATGELVDGRCPEHDVAPEMVEEENYFFRLSRYTSAIAELLETRALRVVPETRHREVCAFVSKGLEDFSISRSQARARGWGLPVPGDPSQVIYVWFDALTNYITALGYGSDPARYTRFWLGARERVHLIGKDILRFHAISWPAMLLSIGAPVPTTIPVHGFLTRDGRRMSKTLGTGVDPTALVEAWGVDAVRYWLLREVPPGDDADYTEDAFARAYGRARHDRPLVAARPRRGGGAGRAARRARRRLGSTPGHRRHLRGRRPRERHDRRGQAVGTCEGEGDPGTRRDAERGRGGAPNRVGGAPAIAAAHIRANRGAARHHAIAGVD